VQWEDSHPTTTVQMACMYEKIQIRSHANVAKQDYYFIEKITSLTSLAQK